MSLCDHISAVICHWEASEVLECEDQLTQILVMAVICRLLVNQMSVRRGGQVACFLPLIDLFFERAVYSLLGANLSVL